MKHISRKLILVLIFCGTISATISAQQAATQPAASTAPADSAKAAVAVVLPTVDQLLDNYVKAIGGRDAWMKINSRISKGTIDVPAYNVTGTVEVHQKAPDSMLYAVVIAGQAFQRGFDGKVAWADDPSNGVKEETGAAFDAAKSEADFYHQLDLRKIYSNLKVSGTEKVGDHDTFVLDATNAEGDIDKMYFDTKTWLLVRSANHRHTDNGVVVYQADIDDYRDVNGIKIPFTVNQTSTEASFTIKYTDIQQNVDLADGQFSKPATR